MPELAANSCNTPEATELERTVVAALKRVYDPEIPVSVYDLGLIYEICVQEGARVAIRMTLTSPGCPAACVLPGRIRSEVEAAPGVEAVEVKLVWDPVWKPDMISEEARLELGLL